VLSFVMLMPSVLIYPRHAPVAHGTSARTD
jgi:hypothetical protein